MEVRDTLILDMGVHNAIPELRKLRQEDQGQSGLHSKTRRCLKKKKERKR
jgi:hypothetical protein